MKEEKLIFISTLESCYDTLSTAERRVADYVIAHPQNILDESAESIAHSTKTSAATVIRFCRSCGFSGLADLRYRIRQEWNVLEGISDMSTISADDSVHDIKQKLIQHHIKVQDAIMGDHDDAAYEAAADALLHAKRILIIGESRFHAPAAFFLQISALLDLPCKTALDALYEGIQAEQMGKGDVVISFCYAGKLRKTADSFRMFKESGVTTICVIGAMTSSLYDEIDILLQTHAITSQDSISALSAAVSHLQVIEILYAVMASKRGRLMELPDVIEDMSV